MEVVATCERSVQCYYVGEMSAQSSFSFPKRAMLRLATAPFEEVIVVQNVLEGKKFLLSYCRLHRIN
jgi:hypothetical protein